MPNRTGLGLALIATLCVGCASAPAARAAPTVVAEGTLVAADTQRFVLRSTRLGHDIQVIVAAPPAGGFGMTGQRPATAKLPAIYALDSGYGIAGPLAQAMSLMTAMEPAYVVSIGYPPSADPVVDLRSTDLLFRPDMMDGKAIGGGGARFLAFLTGELRPFLEARYPLDPNRAVLFGHSFGGLFAANVLAMRPDTFAGYVITSPSVTHDPDSIVPRVAAAAAARRGGRVFVGVGGREGEPMVGGAKAIAASLKAPGSTFEVESQVFADDSHISYYPKAAAAGFAWVLPPLRQPAGAPVTVETQALERLAGAYALADGRVTTITVKDGKLSAAMTGIPGSTALSARSPTEFVIDGFGVEMRFELPASGPAQALVTRMNGADLRAERR